jgi:predicted amidohydrolase
MQDLRITLVQSDLFWEDADANLTAFDQKIDSIQASTDLIILPEMFNTGFSMNPSGCAETMEGKTFQWLKNKAAICNCVVTGSVLIKENNHYYNRLIWMRPDGTFDTYDKRHLFRFANEQLHFSAGNKKLITELKGWKICPLICYDLRFPVWSKNTIINNSYEYDLLIYVANWPERRNHPWKSLLVARAIENMSYAIGVNRVGKDGNDFEYSGDSALVNYKGAVVSNIPTHREHTETIALSHDELISFRQHFPVELDWDHFKLMDE